MHNLIRNALYAIKEASKGTVTIELKHDNKNAAITVHDTAKGIAKENQKQIFAPFFSTKEQGTSVGLGLYFSRLSIEKAGGKIYCLSELK